MICSKCKDEGLTSRVYDHGGFSTCMGFESYYDEQGLWHSHDNNRLSSDYSCSNGHRFSVVHGKSCANCDWKYEGGITFHEPVVLNTDETSSGTIKING